MPTAVISDLHIGAVNKRSLAPEPAALAALAERLEGIDHLVLLGDTLELREARLGEVLAAAEPVFRTLGEALGAAAPAEAPGRGARVTLVAGNHDHQLAAPLLEPRRLNGAGPLPLDAEAPPPPTGPVAQLAAWLEPAELRLAYPGVWIRPDVYATHGHYLDLHNTVPALECLAVSAVERVLGRSEAGRRSPDDYEAALAPFYALAFELAQASTRRSPKTGGGASVKIWRATGGAGDARTISGRLLADVAIPAAVAALNRTGLGPFRPDLDGPALRRAGLEAVRAAVTNLGVEAPHVIFGHTHRSGPWPGDDASEWALPAGGTLTNSGCWIHDAAFGATGPYVPGTCVFVPDGEGPPRLERLLPEDAATRT